MAINGTGSVSGGPEAGAFERRFKGRLYNVPKPADCSGYRCHRGGDRVSLSEQLAVSLRTANDGFEQVQARIIQNRETLNTYGEIRRGIDNLMEKLSRP